MSTPPAPSDLQALAESRAKSREHHRAILDQMLTFGLTRLQQLDDPTEGVTPTPAEAAASYTAVTKSMRQCMMLADKLAEPPSNPAASPQSEHPQRTAARKRIIRELEDNINQSQDGVIAESLEYELLERLDAPDMEHELATRSVEAIIADIRRDLGLVDRFGPRFHKRRTPSDIDELFRLAAAPPASLSDDGTRLTRPEPVVKTANPDP